MSYLGKCAAIIAREEELGRKSEERYPDEMTSGTLHGHLVKAMIR
jgi:hypothetical protein